MLTITMTMASGLSAIHLRDNVKDLNCAPIVELGCLLVSLSLIFLSLFSSYASSKYP